MLFMVNCYKIKFVIISFAINACYCSYRSDFYRSNWFSRQFISPINCMIRSSVFLLKLAIVFKDLTFIGLICPQNNLFINHMLGSAIYLSPNIVMIAGLSSHKSIFIYYFRIVYYWNRLSSNKGLIEKLWCWRSKYKYNCVQSTIILPFHLQLFW